jgi:hypothetical protein
MGPSALLLLLCRKQEDPLTYKLLFDAQLATQPAHEGLQRPAQFSKRLVGLGLVLLRYCACEPHPANITTTGCVCHSRPSI